MSEINFTTPEAIVSYLTTDLNALANNGSVVGGTITATKDLYIALELYVHTQASARSAGGHVLIYLLPTVDGTNFSYGANALEDAGSLLCAFNLDAAVTARYVVRKNLPLPPFDFKLQVTNKTGQALAATGSTLKYRLYSYESV
jgi:hypothetical protein